MGSWVKSIPRISRRVSVSHSETKNQSSVDRGFMQKIIENYATLFRKNKIMKKKEGSNFNEIMQMVSK